MENKERLRRLKLGLPPLNDVPIYTDATLNAASSSLAKWMAETFNHNFDAYDAAIDSIYSSTRIGGSSYHHILDGQHDILGAFRAVKDVSYDDSFVKEILEASEHLLRDTASISGINPLFSLTSNQFDKLADMCATMGISKPYLADALTINGPELIGGSLALLSTLIIAKDKDPTKLSSLSGAYLVSSLASANPVMLPLAAGGLVYSIREAEDKKEVLIKAGKGSLVSGASLITSGLIGGPVWLGCIVAVSTAVTMNYAISNPVLAFEKAKTIVKPAGYILRKVSINL